MQTIDKDSGNNDPGSDQMQPSSFVIAPLGDHKGRYHDTIRLIEESFQYDGTNHFDIDFAPLLHKDNLKNSFLLLNTSTGEVAGHIGVMKRNLVNKSWPWPVPLALIGGVCIGESYRGKGLLNFFLARMIQQFQNQVALFLLWGQHQKLYKKFHFHLGIGQLETGPTSGSSLDHPNFKKAMLRDLDERDKLDIRRLYEEDLCRNYATLARNEGHWQDIELISSAELRLGRDELGRIESYFFKGKGKDLTGVIHEMGQREPLKKSIIRELAQDLLWRPEADRSLLEGLPHRLSYMAMIRPGNGALFSRFIDQWSGGKVKVLKCEPEQDMVTFHFEGKEFVAGVENFLLCLFGPNPAPEFTGMGKPIFICGLDSI